MRFCSGTGRMFSGNCRDERASTRIVPRNLSPKLIPAEGDKSLVLNVVVLCGEDDFTAITGFESEGGFMVLEEVRILREVYKIPPVLLIRIIKELDTNQVRRLVGVQPVKQGWLRPIKLTNGIHPFLKAQAFDSGFECFERQRSLFWRRILFLRIFREWPECEAMG